MFRLLNVLLLTTIDLSGFRFVHSPTSVLNAMHPPAHSVWLHRFAWLTAALTLLLPVTTGAIVTTLKAGMAFSDWPSSDGHNMLTYPWLSSARDQFIEHGHRLAGMTIGFVTVLLLIATFFLDRRFSIRALSLAIFAAVFTQGMLGGARVRRDEQLLALIHGDFAALVFSLMVILVIHTSRTWDQRQRLSSGTEVQRVSLGAFVVLVSLVSQYVMGGFLRHLRDREGFGWAWVVHPWFAIAVVIATIGFLVAIRGTGSTVLSRCAMSLVGLTIAQSLLGLATWSVKYGILSLGIVAEQNSVTQYAICSLHKVLGLLTMSSGVMAMVCSRSLSPVVAVTHSSEAVAASVVGAVTV